MKKILIIIAAAISCVACQQKKYGAFTVTGKVEHAQGQLLTLQELQFNGDQPVVMDSASVKPNGSFELHGMGKEEGVYRLSVANGPDVWIINDNSDIKVQLDLNNYRAYKISGSPASESMHTFLEDYYKKDSSLYVTLVQIDTLQKQNASDSVISLVRRQRDTQVKDINKFVTDYINQSNSAAARYSALGLALRTMSQEEVLPIATAAADKFKEHSGLAKLKSALIIQKPATPKYALLGQQAPEINMPDINGKPFQLSSLRGKYVLVDFWASWCGPCRRENPNVVTAYNKFKDKNFTILGVSLDKEKADWQAAVAQDKLNWTQVSDLKWWETSVVGSYQFDGIPFNVLIDPQGKIIASSLRGEELEKKLAEVLK